MIEPSARIIASSTFVGFKRFCLYSSKSVRPVDLFFFNVPNVIAFKAPSNPSFSKAFPIYENQAPI